MPLSLPVELPSTRRRTADVSLRVLAGWVFGWMTLQMRTTACEFRRKTPWFWCCLSLPTNGASLPAMHRRLFEHRRGTITEMVSTCRQPKSSLMPTRSLSRLTVGLRQHLLLAHVVRDHFGILILIDLMDFPTHCTAYLR